MEAGSRNTWMLAARGFAKKRLLLRLFLCKLTVFNAPSPFVSCAHGIATAHRAATGRRDDEQQISLPRFFVGGDCAPREMSHG